MPETFMLSGRKKMMAHSIDAPPVACTLAAGDYKARIAWIADLNAAVLRAYRRDDLRLELTYALDARDRVSEMVRREQGCCPFLTFEVCEARDGVRLTIVVPERARDAVDGVFAPFLPAAAGPSGCACCGGAAA
jgi:hypothetical protein